MNVGKTKSLENIEEKMEHLDRNSLRYQILEKAKNFKTSWIELGRLLYSVFKDKLYRNWGYINFDSYTAKEIGIRKQTAMKLLRSYFFLEKEEPSYLKEDYLEAEKAALVPTFESVDVLRMAKNKQLDEEDYVNLKSQIFQRGRDVREVRKDLTNLIRQRVELEPKEARRKRRVATVKRFLSTLKSLRQELELGKLIPDSLLKETDSLIKKLEEQI